MLLIVIAKRIDLLNAIFYGEIMEWGFSSAFVCSPWALTDLNS